jgi:hypothetical protein
MANTPGPSCAGASVEVREGHDAGVGDLLARQHCGRDLLCAACEEWGLSDANRICASDIPPAKNFSPAAPQLC